MTEPMRARPLIFSAESVRGIIAGTKHMTRRLLKPQPEYYDGCWDFRFRHGGGIIGPDDASIRDYVADVGTPYAPGELRWVKEVWAKHTCAEDRVYHKGDHHPWGSPIYRATFGAALEPKCEGFTAWRSPRYMPRWASRLTVEITAVKVERLQEISVWDVIEEGTEFDGNPDYESAEHAALGGISVCPERHAYACVWNRLHGPGSWEANPWICCVSFKRLENDNGAH